MEKWDLYDVNRNIIGEHIRGDELPSNGYHLVVHVWIKNNKNKYLMTQRAATRPSFPLKWECVGGSVIKGETSIQGVLREVKEEVGIDLVSSNGKVVCTKIRDMVDGRRINDIVDIWLFTYDGRINLLNATSNEVAQAKWMDRKEIKCLFESGEMVSTIKDLRYFLYDTINF